MALAGSNALCTLAAVKEALGIPTATTTRDAVLETRIKAASTRIEKYCARSFKRVAGKVEKMAGYGTSCLLPALTPVEVITSLAYGDTSYVVADLDIEEGVVIRWAWGIFPHTTFLDGGIDPTARAGFERKALTLTYTGGWVLPNDTPAVSPQVDLPLDLQEACAQLAADMDRRLTRDQSLTGESVGDASASYGVSLDAANSEAGGIPGYVRSMLSGYKRAV